MKDWVKHSGIARGGAGFGDTQIHYLPNLKETEVTIHPAESWSDYLSFFRSDAMGRWQLGTLQDSYDLDDDPEMVAVLDALFMSRLAVYELLTQRLGAKNE